ncbi:MAG: calcineurin-like phosphoesterase family protein [Opitutales bacterium]|nr:calcineurin-like phosphoesterase family protein [Opitutales bacterium]
MRTLLFALLLLPSVTYAGQTATGFVFHDENQNSIKDSGEKGIASVLVSNGTEVVATDDNGAYELKVTDDTILFVIQPKGWGVPVNEFNLPQFYYIHKPNGSPEGLEYPGVSPTGPLPDSVDFPLNPSETGEKFSLFAFGDPQPYTIDDVDYFRRDIVEEARELKGPVAGVSLGDIVGDDLDLFHKMNAVTALMDRPWWHVYGNHDMNFDAKEGKYADETFESIYGPPVYAFQISDVVFVALDNVLFPYKNHRYMGGFDEWQLTFLENLLEHIPSDKLIVTMMHIPLYDEGYTESKSFLDEDRKKFFALFKDHPHTLSLSAHTHTQNHHFFDHDHDHWPHLDVPHHHYNVGTTSGNWWSGDKDERGIPVTTMRDGTPNGYAILNFEGNTYTYDYKVANAPSDYVMSIYAPKALYPHSYGNGLLAVNFFNGSEQAKVEYRINERKWKTAKHTKAPDPQYTYNRLKRDQISTPSPDKPLSYPVESNHIWIGSVPSRLEPGIHTIQVRITDRFGRVFEDSTTYRIIEENK